MVCIIFKSPFDNRLIMVIQRSADEVEVTRIRDLEELRELHPEINEEDDFPLGAKKPTTVQ